MPPANVNAPPTYTKLLITFTDSPAEFKPDPRADQ